MKAALVRDYGGPERLVLEDRAAPEPGPGEITIDVAFAGVGFVDTLVRAGVFTFAQPPMVPGIEVAGTVRSAGGGVTDLERGQRVAALFTDFTGGRGMALRNGWLRWPLQDLKRSLPQAGLSFAFAISHFAGGDPDVCSPQPRLARERACPS